MTQKELAELVGVSTQTVIAWGHFLLLLKLRNVDLSMFLNFFIPQKVKSF